MIRLLNTTDKPEVIDGLGTLKPGISEFPDDNPVVVGLLRPYPEGVRGDYAHTLGMLTCNRVMVAPAAVANASDEGEGGEAKGKKK